MGLKDRLARYKIIVWPYKALKILVREGPIMMLKKVRDHFFNLHRRKKRHFSVLSKSELEYQRGKHFSSPVTFSILVPLYNTPEKFLVEMLESVVGQTYPHWELCLADASDDQHGIVREICEQYQAKDQRIRYEKLEKNLGISENTNQCAQMASGDYIALLDHDDVLSIGALFELAEAIEQDGADFLYTDEALFSKKTKKLSAVHCKPDFSPDTLRSYNYICHLCAFRRSLFQQVGGFRDECNGSQDYDLVLRLTEKAKVITHVPKVLYFWRVHAGSVSGGVSAKPYTVTAAKKAISDHLSRMGLKGQVLDSHAPSTYRVQYEIEGQPLVSILIPNKDHIEDLDVCLRSIFEKSTYSNYEIVIVENNSTEPETFSYYAKMEQEHSNVHVYTYEGTFNYSRINNQGVTHCKGEHILFLNNDIEVITPDWIEQMLMFSQREDVGAVGAMLYYPDDRVQHAGVIVGLGGVAGHSHKYYRRGSDGYLFRLSVAQNLSACTAACLMMRREVFDQVGGFDEAYAVAFNDVDLCLKVRSAEKLIVFTPYAELYHHESISRGQEDTPEKVRRFQSEIFRFKDKWKDVLEHGDPYYNPNLTLDREDFSLD
ncbi:MAG: glycosyltransferase family 2 protein [Massiliimalia sp.]